MVCEFLSSQAEFRLQKAEEYPNDTRNARAAATLEQLCEFVDSLPQDDPRFARLEAAGWNDDGPPASDGETNLSFEVARFGFDGEEHDMDRLFTYLVELVEQVAAETRALDLERSGDDEEPQVEAREEYLQVLRAEEDQRARQHEVLTQGKLELAMASEKRQTEARKSSLEALRADEEERVRRHEGVLN